MRRVGRGAQAERGACDLARDGEFPGVRAFLRLGRILEGEIVTEFPVVDIAQILRLCAFRQRGRSRQHVALIERVAVRHGIVRHAPRGPVFHHRAVLLYRDGEGRGVLDVQRARRHAGEHAADGRVRRDGRIGASQGLAVQRIGSEGPADIRCIGKMEHRAEGHSLACIGGDRTALRLRDADGVGRRAALSLPRQNGIASLHGGIGRAVAVQRVNELLRTHVRLRHSRDGDDTRERRAAVPAVRGRIVVAALEIIAVRDGVAAVVVAADGAASLAAARVDRAGVIAVINVQPAVAAADAARRAGIARRDRAGVVAVDDCSLAPARADDAADALGVRVFDGGVIRAVLQIDARGDAAGAADDAADHAAAVDAAADGEIAHGRGRFRCGLAVIEVAHVADEADALRIGIALFGIAVAEQVRDAVALPVERAVEICHDHTLRVVTVHRIQAADRRPVARAAHIEVGRQIDSLVREIMCGIADIGRAVLAAAARADEQIVVDPRGDELAAVALDAVVRRARVDLPVDEGRKARELCRRVDGKHRLRCVIP